MLKILTQKNLDMLQIGKERIQHFLEHSGLPEITYLDYHRYYSDGRVLSLTTNPELIELFVENKFYATYEENLVQQKLGDRWVVLSHAMQLLIGTPQTYPDKFINNIVLCSHLNIFHRLYFVSHRSEHFLVTGFGINTDKTSIFEYYFNNMEKLTRVIQKLETSLTDFIIQYNNNRIFLPDFHMPSSPSPGLFIPPSISRKDINIHLTRREAECLVLKFQGYSAKDSAKILDLSIRTIEKHFENARLKLPNLSSKEIKAFFSSLKCFSTHHLSY